MTREVLVIKMDKALVLHNKINHLDRRRIMTTTRTRNHRLHNLMLTNSMLHALFAINMVIWLVSTEIGIIRTMHHSPVLEM